MRVTKGLIIADPWIRYILDRSKKLGDAFYVLPWALCISTRLSARPVSTSVAMPEIAPVPFSGTSPG
jgi:hypothetical protein